MNREECIALMPVMQAFIDDEPIQSRYRNKEDDVWIDFGSGDYPALHNSEREWRVKPEKQERWVNVYQNDCLHAYLSRNRADEAAGFSRIACIRIEYTEGEGLDNG